jgi:hypothetical protein
VGGVKRRICECIVIREEIDVGRKRLKPELFRVEYESLRV